MESSGEEFGVHGHHWLRRGDHCCHPYAEMTDNNATLSPNPSHPLFGPLVRVIIVIVVDEARGKMKKHIEKNKMRR